MSVPVGQIISSIISALPGLAKLIAAFRGKPEPTSDDISTKAKNEIDALEEWRKSAKEQAGG